MLNYKIVHVQPVSIETPFVMPDGSAATLTQDRLRIEMIADGHDGSSIIITAPLDDTTYVEGEVATLSLKSDTAPVAPAA